MCRSPPCAACLRPFASSNLYCIRRGSKDETMVIAIDGDDQTSHSLACGIPRAVNSVGQFRFSDHPFAVDAHCIMRLKRILIFPFFALSIIAQLPLTRRTFQKCSDANKRYSLRDRYFLFELPGSSSRLAPRLRD